MKSIVRVVLFLILLPTLSYAKAALCSQLFFQPAFEVLNMRFSYQKSDIDLGVHRFSEAEQLQNRVTVKEGLLYYKGKLLDTHDGTAGGSHRRGLQILALDLNFNMITIEHAPVDVIHQSSLVGGKKGLFFGEWRVKNGKVTMISNMSGHYRPSVEQLELFVQLLKDLDVVDSNIDVVDVRFTLD